MKRALVILVVVSGLSLTATAHAAESVYWKQFPGGSESEPTELVTSYGTSSSTMRFQNLVWEGWGEGNAVATGTALVKSCNPNCLSADLAEGSARVYLSEIRSVCGQRRYMHIRVSVTDLPDELGPYNSDYDDVTCQGNMVNPSGRPYPNRKPKPSRERKYCGEPKWARSDRGGKLFATGTTCARAQGITARFVRRIQDPSPTIRGYRCSGGSYHGSNSRFYILCVNEKSKIKWVGNAVAIFGASY